MLFYTYLWKLRPKYISREKNLRSSEESMSPDVHWNAYI